MATRTGSSRWRNRAGWPLRSRAPAPTYGGAFVLVREAVDMEPEWAQAQAPGRFTLEHLFDSVPPPRRPQTNIHREREPSGMPLCMPEAYCYVSAALNRWPVPSHRSPTPVRSR